MLLTPPAFEVSSLLPIHFLKGICFLQSAWEEEQAEIWALTALQCWWNFQTELRCSLAPVLGWAEAGLSLLVLTHFLGSASCVTHV